MKAVSLNINSLPFNRKLPFLWEGFLVGSSNVNDGWIKKLSTEDYSEVAHIEISYNVYSYLKDGLYFYHSKDKSIKLLDVDSFRISNIPGHLFPKYKWEDLICHHNLLSKEYEVFSKQGDKTFEFKYQNPLATNFINSGILLYQNNEKKNNWIRCLNPDGGSEKWKKEFSWQFVRLETYDNLIVLEYQAYDKIRTDKGYEGERDWYNPDKYTIVLDGDTGVEIWRYPNSYHQIDYEKGVVLIGNVKSRLPSGKIESLSAVELNIRDGNVLTNVEVTPSIERVPNFHFVDESGIYYTSHDGTFGKISKTAGAILWEFDLIDEKGEKRQLSDWLLLGNGNLVLQAMSNHSNGNLTCIFNPEENLEYSKVNNGERISPDYA